MVQGCGAACLSPDKTPDGLRRDGLVCSFQVYALKARLQAGLKTRRLAVHGGAADEKMDAAFAVPPIAPEAGATLVVGGAGRARPEAFSLEV